MDASYIAYPIRFDGRGRTASSTYENHVRAMIEQVLFTIPGERVNRPDFGSGLLQLVFEPNSSELVAALQYSVQASLQRWLGDIIDLRGVEVLCEDASLRVMIDYVIRDLGQRRIDVLERSL